MNIAVIKELFIILTFMIVMILVPSKLSPSYAMSITYYQVNTGPQQDKTKQIVDTNAFSIISRNMTSSTAGSGQSFVSNATDISSSKSPMFATGDNSNSTNKVGKSSITGNGGSGISSSSAHHGTGNGGSGISSSSTLHGAFSSHSNRHSSGKSISSTVSSG
jgi:hypothetical protein